MGRCEGITKAGTRCKNKAKPKQKLCHLHAQQQKSPEYLHIERDIKKEIDHNVVKQRSNAELKKKAKQFWARIDESKLGSAEKQILHERAGVIWNMAILTRANY